jgi:hypothetical protein
MQTILKVVCGNRGPSQMIEDLAAAFSSRFDIESTVPEFPPPGSDDVAIAIDDCLELRNSTDVGDAILGSFCTRLRGNEQLQFILVNPVIVSYRPNGQKLRFLIGSPSQGKTGSMESE